MINEEFLAKIPGIQTTCCLIHAVKNFSQESDRPDKQILTLIKLFNRLSDNCQDFLCLCMQQRFSKNEMKKYQITSVCTTSDLKNHNWIVQQDLVDKNGAVDGITMKKKKSQFNLHDDGNMTVILSLKELLNVSSDWMDVKSKAMGGSQANSSVSTNVGTNSSVPVDF